MYSNLEWKCKNIKEYVINTVCIIATASSMISCLVILAIFAKTII